MKHSSLQSGFTLVETLVAVFIFSTALVSLLTIAARGIQANASADLDIAAQYLAQEGIELAVNTRNSNFVGGFVWDSGVSGCGTGCFVEYTNVGPTFVPCTAGMCPTVLDNGLTLGNGLAFAGSGTNATPFTRTITTTSFVRQGVQVVSRVDWQDRGTPRSVEYMTTLYEWFPPAQ